MFQKILMLTATGKGGRDPNVFDARNLILKSLGFADV